MRPLRAPQPVIGDDELECLSFLVAVLSGPRSLSMSTLSTSWDDRFGGCIGAAEELALPTRLSAWAVAGA